MPKTLTPAMRAHLDAETTRLAAIWRITRKDGAQFFFTDHDRDIVFGGDTYRADAGFERTAIRSDAGFAVDNLDLTGVFAKGGIALDGSGAQPLAQSTLEVFSPNCRADLGDRRCRFPIQPPELDPDILGWRAEGDCDPKFLSDLVELRRTIEPAAAELAATRASAEAIQAIEEAYHGMERAGGREEAVVSPDVSFHRAVLEASGNDLLASLGGVIEAALAISFRFSSVADDAIDRSLPLHEAVLLAIRRRQPKVASAAMRRLIQASAEDIDEVLKTAEPRQEVDIV